MACRKASFTHHTNFSGNECTEGIPCMEWTFAVKFILYCTLWKVKSSVFFLGEGTERRQITPKQSYIGKSREKNRAKRDAKKQTYRTKPKRKILHNFKMKNYRSEKCPTPPLPPQKDYDPSLRKWNCLATCHFRFSFCVEKRKIMFGFVTGKKSKANCVIVTRSFPAIRRRTNMKVFQAARRFCKIRIP